jgi:hypothetical protein
MELSGPFQPLSSRTVNVFQGSKQSRRYSFSDANGDFQVTRRISIAASLPSQLKV